ncbi:MAG: type IV secretory system conjugative DNA transfer family protein, partial [Lachnospiraceae bacterium]|nr:type IV secretory system conjugative DNA transfer family protein [Lachnospiraceae bacterium]
MYGCGFAAIFLDQTLKNPEHLSWITNPIEMYVYVLGNKETSLFTALFIILITLGIITLWFSGLTKTYQSDVMEITPDISIPVPAGQGQYGSARFLTKKEINEQFEHVIIDKRKLLKNQENIASGGLVIGKEDLKHGKEKIYHVTKDRHSIGIGATRAGKTRHIVLETIADLLLAEENIFVVDMKKEIYDYTHKKAEELGYIPIRIDFINPYQSDRKNYLEPIIKQLKRGDTSKAIEETWSLVSQLVGEPPQNGEKLWNNGEAATLAASIMAVCYDNQNHPEYQNLTNVFYFITEMCQDYKGALPLQFYIDALAEDHPSRILLAATKLAAFKTRSSFYVSATMSLKLLTMPSINAMTNCSDFDLEELIRQDKKIIVYLCLPARDNTYFPLASLTLRQITDEIDRIADEYGGRVPRRWNFIEDEFGNFTKITNI